MTPRRAPTRPSASAARALTPQVLDLRRGHPESFDGAPIGALGVERGAITATYADGATLSAAAPARIDAEASPLTLEATAEPCRVRVVLDSEARVYEPGERRR
jgi:hypothetical protein